MSNGFYTEWMKAYDEQQRCEDQIWQQQIKLREEVMRHQIKLDMEHQEKVFTRRVIFEKHIPEPPYPYGITNMWDQLKVPKRYFNG